MDATRCGLRPGKPVSGALSVPPSKSLAQRALVAAGLCAEPVWIVGLGPARHLPEDVVRAREALLAVGASLDSPRVTREAPGRAPGRAPGGGTSVRVRGLAPGPGRGWHAERAVRLGESGTLARLASAAAGLCGRAGAPLELAAEGTLLARSSPALFATLAAAGVRCEFLGREHGWPVRVLPLGPPSRLELCAPSSSQEASALLCAAAAWPDTLELAVQGRIPSEPYVAMTVAVLERFGARIERAGGPDARRFSVRGPLRAPEGPFVVEPDASAAAVLLAAACLSGGAARVEGLAAGSAQGDVRVVEHLRAFGCEAGLDRAGAFAGGEPIRGAALDLSGEPDLAPVLAAVAAVAALRHGASSRLAGLGTLQGKESPRIAVLAHALETLGFAVRADLESLEIGPGRGGVRGATLDAHGDHRMAFAFALLGLAIEEVDVAGAQCVAKSWPSFWGDCERAGARLAGVEGGIPDS